LRTLYLSAIAAALAAAPVSAQICTGFPTVDGQKAITAGIGFPEDSKTYSLRGAVDLTGPLSVNGGVAVGTIDEVDDKAYSFGANVAYELKGLSFSACPVVGLNYNTFSMEESGATMDVSALNIPLGFGVGQTFAAGSNSFGLYAVPQFVISRASMDVEIPGLGSAEESETDTFFGADIGALFKAGSFFAGASVNVTSQADSDAVFGLNVGMLFGRR